MASRSTRTPCRASPRRSTRWRAARTGRRSSRCGSGPGRRASPGARRRRSRRSPARSSCPSGPRSCPRTTACAGCPPRRPGERTGTGSMRPRDPPRSRREHDRAMQPARLAPRLAAGVLALVVALATAGCARTAAAGTARITVLQPDGTPAVHVHVGVDDRADPSDRAFTTRTDDGGHAVVRLPRAGTPYLLVAGVAAPERGLAPELPGTVAVYLGARGGPAADPRIPAPFTAAPPGAVTMRLGRSARISGTTEPGRTVELRTSGGRLAGQQRASATGRFAFDVVPGRFRLDVPVDATTRAARSPLITVAPGAARSVDLRSGRNAELAGVVTVDGVPAAGVAVRVVTPDVRAAPADADGALATRTDAAGRYRLAVLSADGGTVVFGGPQRGDGEPAAARTWHLTAAPAGRTITHDA